MPNRKSATLSKKAMVLLALGVVGIAVIGVSSFSNQTYQGTMVPAMEGLKVE